MAPGISPHPKAWCTLRTGYSSARTGLASRRCSYVRSRAADFVPRKARGDYWTGEPCSMLIDEVEAIWARIAVDDDWSALTEKVAAIRAFGAALR